MNVGSFSDPPDIPGLAHLLEHSKCRVKIVCGMYGTMEWVISSG